ncbi:Fanconi anemia group M protein isoform X2 [Fundulus heteroclitus]|uniref:Fanconi anemia group M protein isoform X2 n=1 Tax=Fundulus heteroclitus TaxID=8078 RepID=UPI00165A6501|nr:Fanconi anemia group M protein isoform X2 [Fundulus heteroclitus]
MSGGSNQRTLLQTWGASVSQNKAVQSGKNVRKAPGASRTAPSSSTAQVAPTHPLPPPPPQRTPWTEIGQNSTHAAERQAGAEYVIPEDDDDDDDVMVVAVYEAERRLQLGDADSFQNNHDTGQSVAPLSTPRCGRIYPDFPGFDSSSAEVWIYPTNYPIREYQLKISEAALFQNTLVCLPTGLGKTFIAAVVMYNFYRWYPAGKIVFMAPTKPLVAQQIEACYKVMGIPQEHMAELTGSTAAKQRQEVWRAKRVFFLTPQVMVNDLSRDTCPARQIKCVVIDEAHKASGNHAYCQVIRQLISQTLRFRVLALSATPGGDTKSVQAVISNLLISHIELRSEESPDIQAHSHQRSVEKVVVPLGEKLSAYQARYIQVLEKFMSRLVQNRVMAHKDLRTLSKYQLILARDQFRKNPAPHIKGSHQGVLEGDFALCISLYHGYELLMQMGLRSLFFYIQGIMDGSREMSRAKNELQRTPTFMDLYREMETMFLKPPDGPDEPFVYSHPKLEKLEEVVLQHFNVWAESSADTNDGVSTRVMIFSSFRESVQEIAGMLNRHAPLIRVMTFMGQASAGKGVKGFTQKEQLEVVHRFRQGGFNTLVSTCVGEEGLDIGEVDLIVCFDAQKNPTRLVQRMGRTGRKRQGRIVIILAEGREERTYNQSQSNKRSVYKSITGNRSGFRMYPSSPRMLPDGVNPQLHKMYITCGQFDHGGGSRRSVRGRRSHAEGRPSLIHPQNMIQQERPRSDGLLSRTEYSLWASAMKLGEDEAHPTLKPSRFLSVPGDSPPQGESSRDRPPSRELSLWEWRHWQHKPLPVHAVDHSLRCHHFVKVMELIDGMRDESEGDCRYEEQLLPYLHTDGADKKRQKKPKVPKTSTKSSERKPEACRSSRSELRYVDEDAEAEDVTLAELGSAAVLERRRIPEEPPGDDLRPQRDDPPSRNSADDDLADVSRTEPDRTLGDPANPDEVSELNARDEEDVARDEEDVDLQGMFYLPETCSARLTFSDKPGGGERLQAILANVAELLSRSPPSPENIFFQTGTSPPPSPPPPLRAFPVSFSLEADDDDDDDDDDDISAPDADPGEPAVAEVSGEDRKPDSPTWEEVFEDEDVRCENIRSDEKETDSRSGDEAKERGCVGNAVWDGIAADPDPLVGGGAGATDDEDVSNGVQMDESMDLFEDDEAFLQMTIPDVPTPEDSVLRAETLNAVKTSQPADADDKTPTSDAEPEVRGVTDGEPPSPTAADPSCSPSSLVPESPEPPDRSLDLFSVNFDLGYSLEESEDEAEAPPASPSPERPAGPFPAISNSSTPRVGAAGLLGQSRLSERPGSSLGARRTLLSGSDGPASARRRREEGGLTATSPGKSSAHPGDSSPHPAERFSDSDEEVVHRKRRHHKVNPLSSPEVSKILSDVDSPVAVKKKRASVLDTTDETQAGAFSDDDDDDFRNDSAFPRRKSPPGVQQPKNKAISQKARQFLVEEAELSEDEEGAAVSSDEEDGADLDGSLEGFVVDNTHLSQGLNDSEMQGVYLKSVRSPAVRGKFRMSYKARPDVDVFSQVPELDETYAEDSFVVGSDEEEPESHEEEPEEVELLPEASYVDGRRQYATRRRVFLHRARAGTRTETGTRSADEQRARSKRSRLLRLNDSSEEDTEEGTERSTVTGGSVVPPQANRPPPDPSGPTRRPAAATTNMAAAANMAAEVSLLSEGQRSSLSARCRQKLENQHLLSDELDFAEPESSANPVKEAQGLASTSAAPPPGSVCVLVDSRCISGGVELVTSLRQRHGARVHVCSLDASYFIVSNRMAVDRWSQSDLASMQNRRRLVERLNNLQRLFERVCLVVETDRCRQAHALLLQHFGGSGRRGDTPAVERRRRAERRPAGGPGEAGASERSGRGRAAGGQGSAAAAGPAALPEPAVGQPRPRAQPAPQLQLHRPADRQLRGGHPERRLHEPNPSRGDLPLPALLLRPVLPGQDVDGWETQVEPRRRRQNRETFPTETSFHLRPKIEAQKCNNSIKSVNKYLSKIVNVC